MSEDPRFTDLEDGAPLFYIAECGALQGGRFFDYRPDEDAVIVKNGYSQFASVPGERVFIRREDHDADQVC